MGAGVEQQALRSPGTQAVGPVTGAEGLREMGPCRLSLLRTSPSVFPGGGELIWGTGMYHFY